MGCSTSNTIPDLNNLRQIDTNLSKISKDMLLTETIERAKNIVISINKLRKNIMNDYYNMILKSGACVYVNPTITHCIKCLFYKISVEFNGNLDKINLRYIEDPPYMSLNTSTLSEDTKERVNYLFNFIITVRNYKVILNLLDKDIPELIYLIHEDSESTISDSTKERIKKAIASFHEIIKVRNLILKQIKDEIYFYITRNELYCKSINAFGREAIKQNITDIHEIAMLHNQISKTEQDIPPEKLFSNVNQAKKTINELIEVNNNE